MNELSQMFLCRLTLSLKPTCCPFRERKSDCSRNQDYNGRKPYCKIVKHHVFPKQWIILCPVLTLLFFMSDSFSEEGCHVVSSKSNSEETVCSCNHLTHFAVLMDYDGSTKVIKLFLPYWIILWARWTNSILSFNFSFFDTAHRGGGNNSENYHLCGTEPFHRRDTCNINTLFLPHVSNVPE